MVEALGLLASKVPALGLVLLALGGNSIGKGASGLTQRFGCTPVATGLALVAFATSLPEPSVNLQAIQRGQDELAFGNAFGRHIANVGLTLAVAALAFAALLDPMLRGALRLGRRKAGSGCPHSWYGWPASCGAPATGDMQ